MEILIGILLLAAFFVLIVYSYKSKGGSLMLGMLVMACVYTILTYVGNHFLVTNPEFLKVNANDIKRTPIELITYIFQGGAENWGVMLVNVCFGAWFGRVMLETNVAPTIIRKAVELGGDKPGITCILLNFVTVILFTSIFGAGAVIAIGIIVLPIMLSLGIPKAVAAFSYIGSVACGLYLNPVQFTQNENYAGVSVEEIPFSSHWPWAIGAMIIIFIIITIFTLFFIKKEAVRTWAAETTSDDIQKTAPAIALIAPAVPVALLIIFKIQPIPGYLITSFYALLVCKRLTSFVDVSRFVAKTFHDGVVDIAPFVGFVLMVPMFVRSANMASPYFAALLGDIIPQSPLFICIILAALAPLALYRGPLTLAGSGVATLGVLKSIGYANSLLFPLFSTLLLTMHVGACITQSWTVWGVGYLKIEGRDYLKHSVIVAWICIAAINVFTYIMRG
ncbi:MAG: hypothetical protein LBG22_01840 [Treponema sp.]|jgi:hypothetical protein|nr:hypothetical protein [Treponema sp.]